MPRADTFAPLVPGNIDLTTRPIVHNKDGSYSTVRSITVGVDDGVVVIPTVSDDGRIMTNREAIDSYKSTGRHLGIFKDDQSALLFSKRLHNDQSKLYGAHPK